LKKIITRKIITRKVITKITINKKVKHNCRNGYTNIDCSTITDTHSFAGVHGMDVVSDSGVDDRLVLNGAKITSATLAEDAQGKMMLQGYEVTHDEAEGTLTLTQDDASITLANWQDGDYGISLPHDIVTFRFETTINARAVGGAENDNHPFSSLTRCA
jgi:hypothetical protein